MAWPVLFMPHLSNSGEQNTVLLLQHGLHLLFQCLAQSYCRTTSHYPHQTCEPLDPIHPHLMPPLRNSAGKSKNCQRAWDVQCPQLSLYRDGVPGKASDVLKPLMSLREPRIAQCPAGRGQTKNKGISGPSSLRGAHSELHLNT